MENKAVLAFFLKKQFKKNEQYPKIHDYIKNTSALKETFIFAPSLGYGT